MFYPIIKVLQYEGWTNLVNYPPNNWENKDHDAKLIYILWADGQRWHSKALTRLAYGESFGLSTKELSDEIMQNDLAFLYPSSHELPPTMPELPNEKNWITQVPVWRATVGIKSDHAQVSYQGEMEPFPEKASLLTFHPFIQFGNFDNYLVTLNLQKTPATSPSELEIYNSYQNKYIGSKTIKRNSATVIPLNDFGFSPTDLPVFINREMSAIPFGFGCSKNGHMLSLEHTHPPGSLVLHGNRMAAQSGIKKSWFKKLVKHEH